VTATPNQAILEIEFPDSKISFQILSDTAPVMIWLSDQTKGCTYFNKKWCDFTGRPLSELTGDGWAQDVHPDDLGGCLKTYIEAFDARQPFVMEYRLRRYDGEYRWLIDNGVPRWIDGGTSFAGYIGSCIDITDRKLLEEAYINGKNELSAIYENTPSILCLLDSELRLINGNRVFMEATGWSNYPAPVNKGLGDLLGCIDALEDPQGCGFASKCATCSLRRAIIDTNESGTSYSNVEHNTTLLKNGNRKEAFLLVSTARIESSGSHRVLLSLVDITERKQAEDIQRGYAHRLIEREENLRKKIAAELHDGIGRDLTALGINMSIISHSLDSTDTSIVDERISDCGQLIEGISRTTRNVIANLRPPVLDDFGLLSALQWHTEIFSKRTGLQVTIQADEAFPRLNGEKEMTLFRIAQEALTNVAKHAGAASVTLALTHDGRRVRLVINDDGAGFLPVSSSRNLGSSGWGTTIMRERAELIGGIFSLDSAPGKGTTMSVVVPLEEF
jgi:PAS domain S-box-containing protein